MLYYSEDMTMNSLFFKAIFVAIIGLGLLSPQLAEAGKGGSKTVNMGYAGSGFNTAFYNDGYDASTALPVSLSQANGKGSFGKFAITITTEFALPTGPGNCAPDTDELEFPLISSEAVTTFEDQSQLFFVASGGYSCVSQSTGYYYGQVEGDYVGGTGRFEGATGTITSPFEGQNLGAPNVGFRSITGTAEGTLNRSK